MLSKNKVFKFYFLHILCRNQNERIYKQCRTYSVDKFHRAVAELELAVLVLFVVELNTVA